MKTYNTAEELLLSLVEKVCTNDYGEICHGIFWSDGDTLIEEIFEYLVDRDLLFLDEDGEYIKTNFAYKIQKKRPEFTFHSNGKIRAEDNLSPADGLLIHAKIDKKRKERFLDLREKIGGGTTAGTLHTLIDKVYRQRRRNGKT